MDIGSELLGEEISTINKFNDVAGICKHLNKLNVLNHLPVSRVFVLIDVGFNKFFWLVIHAHYQSKL